MGAERVLDDLLRQPPGVVGADDARVVGAVRDVGRRLVAHVGAHGRGRALRERLLGEDPRPPRAGARVALEVVDHRLEHGPVAGVEHVGVGEVDRLRVRAELLPQPGELGGRRGGEHLLLAAQALAHEGGGAVDEVGGVLVQQRLVPAARAIGRRAHRWCRLHTLLYPVGPLRARARRRGNRHRALRGAPGGEPDRRACRRRPHPGTGTCRSSAARRRRSARDRRGAARPASAGSSGASQRYARQQDPRWTTSTRPSSPTRRSAGRVRQGTPGASSRRRVAARSSSCGRSGSAAATTVAAPPTASATWAHNPARPRPERSASAPTSGVQCSTRRSAKAAGRSCEVPVAASPRGRCPGRGEAAARAHAHVRDPALGVDEDLEPLPDQDPVAQEPDRGRDGDRPALPAGHPGQRDARHRAVGLRARQQRLELRRRRDGAGRSPLRARRVGRVRDERTDPLVEPVREAERGWMRVDGVRREGHGYECGGRWRAPTAQLGYPKVRPP